jgi:hypothetical protein
MLIHLQTVIQTTYALVDESGDVVRTKTVNVLVNRLNKEGFEEALNGIVAAKAQVAKDIVQGE